VDDILWK